MTRRVAFGIVTDGESTPTSVKLAPLREHWHDDEMARRTKTPDTSRIARTKTVAYARAKKSGGDDGTSDGPDDESQDAKTPGVPAAAVAKTAAVAATPEAAKILAPQALAETERIDQREMAKTMAMPALVPVGKPPDLPPPPAAPAPEPAPAPARSDAAEDPTHMPGPGAVPAGAPTDPAAPPGVVPRGDSRSLRNAGEFALIYRRGTFVISRFGSVGTRGQWRVVEYPTSASASHAYAKECSRFVSEGFSDYRG